MNRANALSRRDWMRLSAAGFAAGSMSGWLEALATDTAAPPTRGRSCILLWMAGGPSQMDTFDLKPGHANGGQFKEIDTSVPGVRFSEHLPLLAKQAEHLAIVRSMSTKEGDHSRGTYLMRNGYLPQGPIRYPTFGSLISKELGQAGAELPNFVSIGPYRVFSPQAYTAGFLGSEYDPLLVGDGAVAARPTDGPRRGGNDYGLKVADLEAPSDVTRGQVDQRLNLLGSLNDRFVARRPVPLAVGHRVAYERAVRLMRSEAGRAFNLDEEPREVRDAYGRHRFGQGCLLARRLVERGVPFAEVTLSGVDGENQVLGWDTHADNFATVRQLSGALDSGFSMLIKELAERGLLETTTIVWMGEFGRTPAINPSGGRDHFPAAWSTVVAGGGIKGGQIIGRTSADGMTVEDRRVSVSDLLATVSLALGIDREKSNISNIGRPIKVIDPQAKPISEALV
jgi:hypothetical protein